MRAKKKNTGLFILLLGGLCVMGVTMRKQVKGIWEQALYLQKQAELCDILLPADTVIYTENPELFNEVKPGRAYTSYAQYRKGMPEARESKLVSYTIRGRFSDSANVVNLNGSYSYGQKMSAPSEDEWIVQLGGVQVFPYHEDLSTSSQRAKAPGKGYRTARIGQAAFRPATWEIGSLMSSVSISGNAMLLSPEDCLTVWAPQPVPGEKAKVHVQYELNGEKGFLEGNLCYDGKIWFSILSGPIQMLMVEKPYVTKIYDVAGLVK